MTIQEEVFVDEPTEQYNETQKQIINILSENKYSISQTRCLFKRIIDSLERFMPITNDTV